MKLYFATVYDNYTEARVSFNGGEEVTFKIKKEDNEKIKECIMSIVAKNIPNVVNTLQSSLLPPPIEAEYKELEKLEDTSDTVAGDDGEMPF